MTEEITKPTEPTWMELVRNVSDNGAAIKWPLDRWGYTSDLRKAVVRAAANTTGNAAKEELLVATLMIALAHVKKRRDKDRRMQAERAENTLAAELAREPMERFGLQLVTKKETVNG